MKLFCRPVCLLSFATALAALNTSCRLLKPSDVEQASAMTEGHASGVQPLPARGLKAPGVTNETNLTRDDAVVSGGGEVAAGSADLAGMGTEAPFEVLPAIDAPAEGTPLEGTEAVATTDEHPVVAGGSPFGAASATADGESTTSQVLSAVGNGGSPSHRAFQVRGQLVAKMNAQETVIEADTTRSPLLPPAATPEAVAAIPAPSPGMVTQPGYPYPVPASPGQLVGAQASPPDARPQMTASLSGQPQPAVAATSLPPEPMPQPTAQQTAMGAGVVSALATPPSAGAGAVPVHAGPATSEFEHQ
jgi:hypothetical protein